MATVRYFPNDGPPISTALHKPVTTLGRALGNDIHLPDASVAHHHAQIVFNGRDFQLEELDREGEILINGKKKRRARLANGENPGDLQVLRERLADAPCGQGYGQFVLGELAYNTGDFPAAREYLRGFVKRSTTGRVALAVALEGEVGRARRLLTRMRQRSRNIR